MKQFVSGIIKKEYIKIKTILDEVLILNKN